MSNAPRPPAAVPATSYQQQRQRLYKYKLILGGAVLAIAVVAVMGSKLFSISVPNGTPLGLSASASNNVVALIQTLEAYTPSLHRNHANDRCTVSLFVYRADGASKGRMIRIGKGFRASELNLMKVLGFDGATVWCLVNRIEGVNLQTGKLVDAEKLRKANPSIDETWDDPRRISFADRLRVTTTDRQRSYEVDPRSLAATPIPSVRNTGKPFPPTVSDILSPAVDRDSRKINSITPLSDDAYLNAGFIRSRRGGTLSVAGVSTSGKLLWTRDTGIDRFNLAQILPAGERIAFVGPRPRTPDRVPEPILVTLDPRTGEVVTTTLWK